MTSFTGRRTHPAPGGSEAAPLDPSPGHATSEHPSTLASCDDGMPPRRPCEPRRARSTTMDEYDATGWYCDEPDCDYCQTSFTD